MKEPMNDALKEFFGLFVTAIIVVASIVLIFETSDLKKHKEQYEIRSNDTNLPACCKCNCHSTDS
jgi:hypothetical protein